MSRRRREEQIARLHQFRESLPQGQQGMVILVLLAYAVSAVTAQSALGIAVIRGLGRAWRQRRRGPVMIMRAGMSRLLWSGWSSSSGG